MATNSATLTKIRRHISSWESIGHFVLLGKARLNEDGVMLPNSCTTSPQDVRRLVNACKDVLGYSDWIARAYSSVLDPETVMLRYDASRIPCYWHVFTRSERSVNPLFSFSGKPLKHVGYLWRKHGSIAPASGCCFENNDQLANYLALPDAGIQAVFQGSADVKSHTLLFGRSRAMISWH